MQRRTFLIGSAATAATAATAALGGGLLYKHRAVPRRDGLVRITPDGDTRVYGDMTLARDPPPSDGRNVLFIVLDDCNDWVGFLANHPGTRTPNLDALARQSLPFTSAYCVAPMCNPARTGVMFGQHPFTSDAYDHSEASFEKYDELAAVTPSLADDGASMKADMIDFGPSGRSRDDDPEGRASAWVAERLREQYDRPFYLAYGAICTHLPWRIPQQFFDMHPLDEIVLPPYRPDDLDDLSGYAKAKIIDTTHIFSRLVEDHLWGKAVQAYQAAISYADDCIGRVLDQLHSSPYADDTIVVVWSDHGFDHGFHLGEKLHIEKFTLWEPATRIPFLLHVPGQLASQQTFTKPVSAIDIGPTIADLSGTKIHAANHAGRSLLPVIADPALADDRPPLMTWEVGNNAVRQDKWRYLRSVTGDVELYDHDADPEELTNLADDPSTQDVQRDLARFLPPVPRDADTRPNAVVGGTD
jgi:arylsulfatase A-like enzyme